MSEPEEGPFHREASKFSLGKRVVGIALAVVSMVFLLMSFQDFGR